jgi:hypothetical protein
MSSFFPFSSNNSSLTLITQKLHNCHVTVPCVRALSGSKRAYQVWMSCGLPSSLEVLKRGKEALWCVRCLPREEKTNQTLHVCEERYGSK